MNNVNDEHSTEDHPLDYHTELQDARVADLHRLQPQSRRATKITIVVVCVPTPPIYYHALVLISLPMSRPTTRAAAATSYFHTNPAADN
ncbi:hypothetical protein BKA70DRAFT_1437671 [Coprinopsis sp. MPI-PUGE-AT-0042]|nr:hypothetical protein BKA70DRAFT_1437671 [Coprinopsis sp. MPI-PUGE-AT-0042]